MPIYKYKALTHEGRTITGLIDVANENIAMEVLEEKGFTIINLIEQNNGTKFDLSSFFHRITQKDLVIFSRQFSVLVSANVTLVQSLKILSEQLENPRLQIIIAEIADEIDGGSRLSDSLSKRPELFSGFYINVIKSGETSGKLDEVLDYLADELEKDYDMVSKIKGAMIYPAFIVSGLAFVGTYMMISVVPKLTAVIIETGGEIPLPTKILMNTSAFLNRFWFFLLLMIIGIIVGLRYYYKSEYGKRMFDKMLLGMPIFGTLFQRIFLVRFTRSLQTLILGGVNISKALTITSEVVTNSVYRDLILETIKEVEDGNSITSVFERSEQFPKMVSQMISIGEKSGKLDTVLGRVTDFYTREINNIISNLMSLMEPIIMVVMGVGVGLMVAAIILPMYKMASSF